METVRVRPENGRVAASPDGEPEASWRRLSIEMARPSIWPSAAVRMELWATILGSEVATEPGSRQSALAIIRGEHAAFDDALSWIRGYLDFARAHRIAPDLGTFEQGLEFIATFMESFHHPKEDEFLFKAVRERTREADEVLADLQQQHAQMPGKFRSLRLALGGTRQDTASQLDDFADLAGRFADSKIEHMSLESGVFALAERVLRPLDWVPIDAAFRASRDPLFGAAADRAASWRGADAPRSFTSSAGKTRSGTAAPGRKRPACRPMTEASFLAAAGFSTAPSRLAPNARAIPSPEAMSWRFMLLAMMKDAPRHSATRRRETARRHFSSASSPFSTTSVA